MGREGGECAIMRLHRGSKDSNQYVLEVCEINNCNREIANSSTQIKVKTEVKPLKEEPLISELSYVIVRLHKDMYSIGSREVEIVHEVAVSIKGSEVVSTLSQYLFIRLLS